MGGNCPVMEFLQTEKYVRLATLESEGKVPITANEYDTLRMISQ
jgi:hypothetical protein